MIKQSASPDTLGLNSVISADGHCPKCIHSGRSLMWTACWCLLDIPVLGSNSQWDAIKRRGLWQAMKSWGLCLSTFVKKVPEC